MATLSPAGVNRSTILLVFAIILLPSLIFVALQFGFGYRAERNALETATAAKADAIMAQIDGSLQRTRASALAMATAATVKREDWRGAYERAREFTTINRDWKSVGMIDVRTGEELFDLHRPYGTRRKVAVDPALLKALEQTPVAFESIRRTGPDCPCLHVLAAVRQGGRLAYIVVVALDPAAIQRQFVANAPHEGLSALVDRDGRFIARTQNIDKRLGMPATHYVRDAIRNGRQGLYRGVTYEGLQNYTAFTTSSLNGWSAHVAVPSARFDTPRWWSRLASGLALLISLALAIGLIWALIRSIAAQRSAEERIQQAQRLEVVGKMTGGIAHDFNNMLAVVIGSLEIVKRRRAAGRDDYSPFLDNAMEGANRAAELTRRLLAFSRRQMLEPVATDINRLLTEMRSLLARTLNETIRLNFELADELWPTFVDPGQLENAIVNLAVNARDAMSSDGEMTIATANVTLTEGQASRLRVAPGDFVRIRAIDNGEGMSQEVVERAFEPFFTTKEVGQGTGLGLSQIYGFMEQSGGTARILSQQGEGATVELYLPRTNKPPTFPPSEKGGNAGIAGGAPNEIILVVEDEDQVRMTTVEALRDLGYSIRHARNGYEALDILRGHPGITLLLTDIVMPGMSGRDLAVEACRQWPNLKVLFTTGYEREADPSHGQIQPSQILRKPFAIADLGRLVRQTLDGQSDN